MGPGLNGRIAFVGSDRAGLMDSAPTSGRHRIRRRNPRQHGRRHARTGRSTSVRPACSAPQPDSSFGALLILLLPLVSPLRASLSPPPAWLRWSDSTSLSGTWCRPRAAPLVRPSCSAHCSAR